MGADNLNNNSDKLYKDNTKTKTVELLFLYYQLYTQTEIILIVKFPQENVSFFQPKDSSFIFLTCSATSFSRKSLALVSEPRPGNNIGHREKKRCCFVSVMAIWSFFYFFFGFNNDGVITDHG